MAGLLLPFIDNRHGIDLTLSWPAAAVAVAAAGAGVAATWINGSPVRSFCANGYWEIPPEFRGASRIAAWVASVMVCRCASFPVRCRNR